MEFTDQQKLFQKIIGRAWEDESFRKELVANPVQTIETFTGINMNIPEGKKLIVRDQTDISKVYINIPQENITNDVELSEEQLEAVSGGVGYLPPLGDYPLPIIDCFPPIPDGLITKI